MATIADYVTKLASAAAGAVGKGEDLATIEGPPQSAAAPAPRPPDWLLTSMSVPNSFAMSSHSHRMPFARLGMACAFADSRTIGPTGDTLAVDLEATRFITDAT